MTYGSILNVLAAKQQNTSLCTDNYNTLFYLTNFKNSKELILKCINEMLQTKYHNYIFYCHNFGNYDLYFIYKVLEEFNLQYSTLAVNTESETQHIDALNNPSTAAAGYKKPEDTKSLNIALGKSNNYYNMNIMFRDDQALKLDIKISPIKKKPIKISIIDSFNILNESLAKLAIDFNVQKQKGKFPYSFFKNDNLTYKGPIPCITFYNNINEIEYKNIIKEMKTPQL